MEFLLGQDEAAGAVAGLVGFLCFFVIFLVFVGGTIVGMWTVFAKAGEPGWASIIPIYNMFVLVKISGKDIIWFVLLFVPCVGNIVGIILMMAVAERFGKDALYGLGMAFLPFIFLPLLGLGSAQYRGAN